MQGDNFTLPDRERVPSVFTALALYFFACAGRLLAGYIVNALSLGLSYFFYDLNDGFVENLSSIVYYVVFIILPVSYVVGRSPGIHEYTRIHPLSNKLSFLCVLAGGLGAMFVTYLSYFWIIPIQQLGGVLPNSSAAVPTGRGSMMITILTSAVLPGICEELLFRGAILSAYEERGSKKAMVISALLFMCMHGSIGGMPGEFISGLILAFIVISTDSLFAGMIYHTVHNSLLLILTYSGAGSAAEDVNILSEIGGAAGLVQVFMLCAAFGGVLFMVLKSIDSVRRDRNFGVTKGVSRDRCWQELVVLGACVAEIMLFYWMDILSVTGVAV